MTMIFSLHDSIAPNASLDADISYSIDSAAWRPLQGHNLIRDKISRPALGDVVERPRIQAVLQRSAEQFPATLICGRAGTGKTTIAAAFAKSQESVCWYTVDSTDAEWSAFSRYLAACIGGHDLSELRAHGIGETGHVDQAEIAKFLVNLFVNTYAGPPAPRLIVMDDIHHLFDAPWFDDFFNLLLYSLPSDVHLLLLCRSKPPGPLWRLRSKQMLNVLDEKVIAFIPEETYQLFKRLGLPTAEARDAQARSFGRVSKLLQLAAKP